ncbi:MAG: EamA family transporter, partial [Candidatus Cloacimonetes bacterium]|nr:EamA family transporter [Candidatus Cloacimonadota bacterium]
TNGFSEFNSITSTNWLIFFIIAFTTGSGAIFLYYFSLKNIKASTATICELCFPMSAILFDYLINKSSLSVTQWLAVIVLIFSIIQVTRIRREK